MTRISPILRTDSYKASQWNQYPRGTQHINSYIEARGGAEESVFFGLQAYLREYLSTPITNADVREAELLFRAHGEPFNREGWDHIIDQHGGYLPLRIEAVDEGSVINTGNVQVQLMNTDPACWWLPSYIETALLRAVWYPSTVATKSREMKKIIAAGLAKTSDIPVEDQIGFKLHDFGARGASSSETAMLGGMAHLVNFLGTDTVEGLIGAMRYYDAGVAGFSIPASEHSTMTSWGRENETEAYNNMLELFSGEGKLLAVVSDSYDIYNAVRNIWGEELREKVMNSGGTLVIRPDSGDPTVVPIEIIEILMERFGYEVNSKGYKVLPSCVRVIQGDGITFETLPIIIDRLIEKGISIDNIAFGMGAGLLQKVDRDTLKYAMKASAIKAADRPYWVDIYKDPVHGGKTSKRGRLGLVYQCGLGSCGYRTVPEFVANKDDENLLKLVYINGELTNPQTFDSVRKLAKI